ncbi:MAG: DUF4412 domain-containing protein [Flavobacteriales bacterium]|nr:DUF4412 domain-containing protein [Flavobacteriales bacterium]
MSSLRLSAFALLLSPLLLSAQKPGTMPAMPPGAMGGVNMVEDKDPYEPNRFIGSFRMVMHSLKDGKEEKGSPYTMELHSKADMVLMKPEVKEKGMREMGILTDLKGKWQYTMMTDDKGKRTAMKMRKMKLTMPDDAESQEDGKAPKVERTNETRTIEGHNCRKYVVTSEDGRWVGWVAEALEAPFMDMMRSFGGGGLPQARSAPGGVNGFAMESEFTSADGRETMRILTRDLVVGKVDDKVFSLQGYDVMEMPVFNFGGR